MLKSKIKHFQMIIGLSFIIVSGLLAIVGSGGDNKEAGSEKLVSTQVIYLTYNMDVEVIPAEVDPNNIRLISQALDKNDDGVIDTEETYAYDTNGNVLSHSYVYPLNPDSDTVLTNIYDEDGNRIQQNQDQANTSRTIDAARYYTYENGLKTEERTDSNYDGHTDKLIKYTYNSSQKVIKEEIDDYGAGSFNRLIQYYYETIGSKQYLSRKETDNNNDGKVDSIISYEYDSNNNLVKELYDNNNDGDADLIYLYKYSADSEDGTPEWIFNYDYIRIGKCKQTVFEIDSNGDGRSDIINTFYYDRYEKLERSEKDSNNDGTIDEIIHYCYTPEKCFE